MPFRAKSPGRVVAELGELADQTGLRDVFVVDNILSMQYLSSVCEELRHRHWDLSLFYEIKANLSREQLRTLKEAGIRSIQPGIESLSSHVLELMRKGSTMLTNIRLLKWASYYGLYVGWNILMGFPGETDEDYLSQARLIPSLHHLPPPEISGKIWLERFSPYFTETTPGITNVRPRDVYRFIYPIEGIDLRRIAYFFDCDVEGTAGEDAHAAVAAELREWRRRWESGPPVLRYERGPTWIEILDTRAAPRRVRIRGWRAAAYEYCGETARTPRRVAEFLAAGAAGAAGPGEAPGEDKVGRFLAECAQDRLAATEDGRYLSLAIPVNSGW
jgi:ribosomal peptide maturation radical SAM protein 1